MPNQKQTTLDGLDEPWKDAATLRELYEDRTQGEVAEWFKERGHDVTISTISYWMKKLEVNTSQTTHEASQKNTDAKCINYETCGNEAPHPANSICVPCLDAARADDSN